MKNVRSTVAIYPAPVTRAIMQGYKLERLFHLYQAFLMTSLMIFTTHITENIKGSLYFILLSI